MAATACGGRDAGGLLAAAEIQTFLARRGPQVVGRIAAIVNDMHDRAHGERRGFFGFFETTDDREASRALFDACRAWLEMRGAQGMRGPVNLSMNYVSGLLVEGFDNLPTLSLPYNPAYYASLLEDYGFRKAHDLLAFVGQKDELRHYQAKLRFWTECGRVAQGPTDRSGQAHSAYGGVRAIALDALPQIDGGERLSARGLRRNLSAK